MSESANPNRRSNIRPRCSSLEHLSAYSTTSNSTMSSQRLWLRAFQRSGPLGRPTPLRSAPQRRFDSNKAEHAEEAMKAKLEAAPRKTVPVPASGHPELVGAADNSFNRERAAIRAHAVQSSGMKCQCQLVNDSVKMILMRL